jgi:hypothetical protein
MRQFRAAKTNRLQPVAPVQMAASSLADLFHGKPATQRKARSAAACGDRMGRQQHARCRGRAFLNAYADADGAMPKGLEPLVSRQYTVEGLPDGVAPLGVLRQAIEQMPGPTRIQVQSVTAGAAGRVARAEFRYERGEPKVRNIRFDDKGKLLASDLFAIKLQAHGAGDKG